MLVKNERGNLFRSFPTILHQEFEESYEVIVIDSGSSDGSVELVLDWANKDDRVHLHQIPAQDFHHARTRNIGVTLSRGRYLVFLGGDAIPQEKTWLATLLKPLKDQAEGRVIATYGRQAPRPDADLNNICRMTYIYGLEKIIKHKDAKLSTKEKYAFSTVNCAIDRTFIDDEFFDETIPVNEDIAFSFKVISKGYKIAYCPDAVVVHSHNYQYWEICQRYFDNIYTFKRTGIFQRESRRIVGDGVLFVRHAMGVLRGHGMVAYIRFFLFLAMASFGATVGKCSNWIPRSILVRLSKYGV
jgi:rhamnosyltransferase